MEDITKRLEKLERQVFMLSELLKEWTEVSFPTGVIHPVEIVVRQRGLNVLSCNNYSDVILPLTKDPKVFLQYYRYLGRYSFRLFMKDLINKREGTNWRFISRYCSERVARVYINFLKKAGIAEISGDSFKYVGTPVRSFGSTLEWYISEVMRREFMAPTLFGVKFSETPHGGDYDVISILQGCLVYIEVKSSPPRGVEKPAVESFLKRLEDLSPDIAVFLVDTELRMKDKIVMLFEEVTGKRVERLVRELFHLHNRIYIINTKKSITANLNRCFRAFFRARGGFDENFGKSFVLSLGKPNGE